MNKYNINIAYIISPHGFGHAARASAVINALTKIHPEFTFHIFTSVPQWFFLNSLDKSFVYHNMKTDVGVVQISPFSIDLAKTLKELDSMYHPINQISTLLTEQLLRINCKSVFCDIAPIGLLAAERLDLPSFLIENFTWDWIYQSYHSFSNDFEYWIDTLRGIFYRATWTIQTEPYCENRLDANLSVSPVSRSPRKTSIEIRNDLNIPQAAKIILSSFGGFGENSQPITTPSDRQDLVMIIPGKYSHLQKDGNIIHLPFVSNYYYPDLVNASDLVIGKAGYSTLSEVFYADVPFGLIQRNDFRESVILEDYIMNHMVGRFIDYQDLSTGEWLTKIDDLLNYTKKPKNLVNGAIQIAEFASKVLQF